MRHRKHKIRPLPTRIAQNQSLVCKVPGCSKYRFRVSGYCKYHDNRNTMYGTPTGKAVYKAHTEPEERLVKAVIKKNLEHPSIKIALDWIGQTIKQSYFQDFDGESAYLSRYNPETDSLPILISLSGVWHHARLNPDIDFDAQITRLLGKFFVRWKCTSTRSLYRLYRIVGEKVYKNIGLTLLNISNAVVETQAKREQMKEDMLRPLEI